MKRVALAALLFAAAVASWRWMRRDRVWEANRKEFDYPDLTGLHASSPIRPLSRTASVPTVRLVSFEFVANTGFAQYTVSAGGHMAAVDDFTPKAPSSSPGARRSK